MTMKGEIIMALYYCKKCGRRVVNNQLDPSTQKCDCCESTIYPIPKEYLDKDVDCFFKDDKTEEYFVEKFIKSSPEFDQYLFDNREKILREKSSGVEVNFYKENGEIKTRVVGSAANQPKCPYCGSTNISKIGVVNRAVSVGLLGLASDKIGKTHKCNKCGSTW